MKQPPTLDLKALRENAVALDEAGISPLGVKLPEEYKKRRSTHMFGSAHLCRTILTWNAFQ